MPARASLCLAATVAVFVASAGLAAGAADTHDVARTVMDVTQAACEAFRTDDVATLDRLLAPDFTLVGSGAAVQSRDAVLAEVRAGDTKYAVFRNHDMTAHVYDHAATVQGITSLEGTSGGRKFAADVRFTDTLIETGGQWRIVVSHATRIPPTP